MAFNKADRFDPVDYNRSRLCKALAHPARIAIVRHLRKGDRVRASALGLSLPLSQPAVSQHLQLLHTMQIIEREEAYPNVHYWLHENLPEWKRKIIDLVIAP